jgi:hypothetical protein
MVHFDAWLFCNGKRNIDGLNEKTRKVDQNGGTKCGITLQRTSGILYSLRHWIGLETYFIRHITLFGARRFPRRKIA